MARIVPARGAAARRWVTCLAAVLVAGEMCVGAADRIGVYDSRSLAIAFVGTEVHVRELKALTEAHGRAKREGDAATVARLEAEAEERQRRLHLQAFGTAPVGDVLRHLEPELPRIRAAAGVSSLVSKWDAEALKQHAGAEQVDVTVVLVDALKPNERQRSRAMEIRSVKPVSREEAAGHPH